MHRPQEQVRDFHRANERRGLASPDWPTYDWEKITGVRQTLIQEEVAELFEAMFNNEGLGVIREMCDILYVVYGLADSMGIDIEPFFEEVHKANMKKSGGPTREDGKVLKPEGWQPPNLERVYQRTYPT